VSQPAQMARSEPARVEVMEHSELSSRGQRVQSVEPPRRVAREGQLSSDVAVQRGPYRLRSFARAVLPDDAYEVPGPHSITGERIHGVMDVEDYPQSHDEALAWPEAKEWQEAMSEEMKSLLENRVWKLVTRPPNANVIKGKWVFRKKYRSNGEVERWKARWVAKGFTQMEGVDYFETFAPVLKYKSLRILLVLAAKYDLELKQMDIVTAFLYADVKETIYVEQPEGFAEGGDGKVCQLTKALYGIKQAPHAWNSTLHVFIVSLGFRQCVHDVCVYIKVSMTGGIVIVAIFVDDIIVAYHKADEKEWLVIKRLFTAKYKVKDLGDLELILGMRVRRDRAKCQLILDQEQYAMKVVDKFRMTNAKAESTPEASKKLTRDMAPKTQAEADVVAAVPYMQAVGSLLYASIATRPDLTHAVNEVCKFMSCYGQQHWTAVKRILRYLKGEPGLGLSYEPRHSNADGVEVCAYTDADWNRVALIFAVNGTFWTQGTSPAFLVKVNERLVSLILSW
jgi:hypothetical protein